MFSRACLVLASLQALACYDCNRNGPGSRHGGGGVQRWSVSTWVYITPCLPFNVLIGSHRKEGGPCWEVGWHASGLGVGLELAGQGLPDSRVVGPMVGNNLLETSVLAFPSGLCGGALPFRTGSSLIGMDTC
eukprot:1136818-Pelagomonas_calceolata.AAC.1